jgi:hypothetical protein
MDQDQEHLKARAEEKHQLYMILKNGIEDAETFDPELAARMIEVVIEYEKSQSI